MHEEEQVEELHWGGSLWQLGKKGPFFLRDGKDGDEVEIEGVFGADATLEEACAVAFRVENKHLEKECVRINGAAVEKLKKWSAVQNSGCPTTIKYSLALLLALDLVEVVGAERFVFKVGLNSVQLGTLIRDCVSMIPSPIPKRGEKSASMRQIEKIRSDAQSLLGKIQEIELFPPEIPPRERIAKPAVTCAKLIQQLQWIERDWKVERDTADLGGREEERFEKVRLLANIWVRWTPKETRPTLRRGLERFPEASENKELRNGRVRWDHAGALHKFIEDYQNLIKADNDYPKHGLWDFNPKDPNIQAAANAELGRSRRSY